MTDLARFTLLWLMESVFLGLSVGMGWGRYWGRVEGLGLGFWGVVGVVVRFDGVFVGRLWLWLLCLVGGCLALGGGGVFLLDWWLGFGLGVLMFEWVVWWSGLEFVVHGVLLADAVDGCGGWEWCLLWFACGGVVWECVCEGWVCGVCGSWEDCGGGCCGGGGGVLVLVRCSVLCRGFVGGVVGCCGVGWGGGWDCGGGSWVVWCWCAVGVGVLCMVVGVGLEVRSEGVK
ncbi:hypothetical protein Tco_0597046 [Tanacetum coccineum]